MKTVAFVPIRLNSKRVANKNMQLLGDRPLLCHILDTLTRVHGIDHIYAYCSSPDIVPWLPQHVEWLRRPTTLDSDTTPGADIYDAFVNAIDADYYLLAHTTSPFIRVSTIETALHHVHSGVYDSAFSAQRIQTFAWFHDRPLNYELTQIPRTQDIDPIYIETSAFYIFDHATWTQQHRRIGQHPYMAIVDHEEAIDIDWPDDFAFAKRLASGAPTESTSPFQR